jgi:hypothetical protein
MPSPVAGPARRPGAVTGAAWALIVVGGLTLLGGAFISSLGIDASIVAVVTVIVLLIGAGNVLAGVLTLRLSPTGRMLGFIFAGLGLFGGIVQLGRNPGSSIVTHAVDGFIIWALATNRDAFRLR